MNAKEAEFLKVNSAYEQKFGELPSLQWLLESCRGNMDKYIAMVEKAIKTGVSLGEFEGTSEALT
jgi:hypothetical protein